MTIEAVRRTVIVNAPIEKTFRVFTESMTTWWPPEHHIGTADMAEAVLEARDGGRWYEPGRGRQRVRVGAGTGLRAAHPRGAVLARRRRVAVRPGSGARQRGG